MSSDSPNKPNRTPDRLDRLAELVNSKGGTLTYIGQLAIAYPDSENWETIVNENGELLRVHLRAMSDQDLIKSVIWGEEASAQFNIESQWLKYELGLAESVGEDARVETLGDLLKSNEVNLFILDNYASKELRGEFDQRRRNTFRRIGKNLAFEKLINQEVLALSYDPALTFELIGYSPI